MRKSALVVFGLAVCSGVSACAGDGDKEVLPPIVLGMPGDTAPTYDDGQEQIFEVRTQVPLPFRNPQQGERPGGAVDPYPRAPFHVTTDTRTTVRFTLSNLDDRQHTVELLVDPWNEFVRYQPGVTMDDEETIPNLSGIDRFFLLPAKGRIEGILTPDDMVELATDLATAMAIDKRPPAAEGDFGGPALFNRAYDSQNRSSEPDLLLGPWIPRGPIAAVTGFDLGLRTREQAKIAVEIVVDVEDVEGERIVQTGDDAPKLRAPGAILTPPAAPRN